MIRFAAIAAVALVVLLGVMVGQARTIGSLKEQRNKTIADLAQAHADLDAQTRVNTALNEAHRACLEEIRVSQDEQWAARGRLIDLESEVKRSQANVRAERIAIYQVPGCEAYRTYDIGAACPGLAGSLRRRAAEVSAPR